MSVPPLHAHQRAELDQHLEHLAMLLVRADLRGAESAGAMERLRLAVDTLAASARSAGFTAGVNLAADLQFTLSLPLSGGAAAERLERELQAGVTHLQKALSQAGASCAAAALTGNALAADMELVADFLIESGDHLAAIERQLLALERDPMNADALNAIFRAFHTIKGLAGFLEFAAIQASAHEVETLLDKARNHELVITPPVVDVILEGADHLRAWMRHIAAVLACHASEEPAGAHQLHARIRALLHSPVPNAQALASELITLAEAVMPAERAAAEAQPSAREARSIKVDTAKLDYLVDIIGQMVAAQSLIGHDPDLLQLQSPRLQRNVAQAGRLTTEIQKTALAMRMLPIGQVFGRMNRLLRDLTRRSGKQAELEIQGEQTELDRTIVEELADPLMHMVRNSLDHGIETPDERRAAGKPATATVGLKAYYQGGNILIEVSDDGRGLNREKILQKAKEKKLVGHADQLADRDVFALIFEPGLSTADEITDISGRGVGMDVVRKQIQKLHGRIDIQSVRGRGTTFFLKLPLTLAIVDGLVIGAGAERYTGSLH